MKNTVQIKGEVIQGAYQRFRSAISPNATEIEIEIDSLGGSVYEGFLISEYIKKQNIPTKAIIVGNCASIATYVARSCTTCVWSESEEGGRFYLVHNPRLVGDFDCNTEYCDAELFLNIGAELQDMQNQIRMLYLHKTKATLEEINELMKNEVRMTPEEALKLGFIDKIITQTKKPMNFFERLQSVFTGAFAKAVKTLQAVNLILTLDNGEELYVESEDGEVEGKLVFSEKTGEPAPNGQHKLVDGREITVEEGIITSVSQVQDAAPTPPTPPQSGMTEEEMQAQIEAQVQAKLTAIADARKAQAKNLSTANKPVNAVAKPAGAIENTQVLAFAGHIAKALANTGVGRKLAHKFKNEILQPDYNIQWEGDWLGEILREKVVNTPDFMRIFTVLENVKYRQILQIAGFLEDIVVPYEGCGTPTASAPATIFDRAIETKKLQVYMEQCADDFNNTILMKLQRNGSIDRADLSGTDLWNLYLELILDAMNRGLFNLFSFGKIASGIDPAYISINGLWTLLIADSDTESGSCVRRLNAITALDNAATTNAEAYLRELYEEADLVLQETPEMEKSFFVTRNVWNNYLTQIEKRTATEGAFILLQDGTKQLMFRGIVVEPIGAWDRALQSPKNPYFGVYNTLMLYTTPKNHYIGIDGEQMGVRAWFDPNTDLNKFKALPVLGYNYALCDLSIFKIGKI